MDAEKMDRPSSVLEAIKMGLWDFEPDDLDETKFAATVAMPGTTSKLDVLADRVRRGQPLWHVSDRTDYEDDA